MPETQSEGTNRKLTWPQTIGIDALVVGTALNAENILGTNPNSLQEFLNNVDKFGAALFAIGGVILLGRCAGRYIGKSVNDFLETYNGGLHD